MEGDLSSVVLVSELYEIPWRTEYEGQMTTYHPCIDFPAMGHDLGRHTYFQALCGTHVGRAVERSIFNHSFQALLVCANYHRLHVELPCTIDCHSLKLQTLAGKSRCG